MLCRSLFFILLSLFLGACTFEISPYPRSTPNVYLLSQINNAKKVSVGSIEGPGKYFDPCRFSASVRTLDKSPFEDYIRSALISELKSANLYDENSNKVISGKVVTISGDTLPPASWTLAVKFDHGGSPNTGTFLIEDEYTFASSAYWATACMASAQAFSPAVQAYLAKLYTDPIFVSFMQK
ncbi:hypothetical protein [Desulfocurvibacter africanus]|uniref:Lipoprotein n=1 Tax=Desulfocurvibacter africanus subsp. africanus str. Walvis Bay TaxID=690850 RepID=F3YWY6_DESAF|nr:hypothetical protein [Desulfocurvibacter africanus]EGJ51710.1 hypothetical protein Desaf_3424 [Desulfocurvibacter africanus subsp. africanus str. Walvis Bay]